LNGRVHMFSFAGGAHLGAPSAGFSLSIGGKQPLQLGACPEHAGDFYVLLGSLSGTAPALPLGNAVLPLVPDAYFFLTLDQPGAANFPGSIGVLDQYGRAQAAFTLPAGTLPSSAGLTLHHAYVVLDQHTLAIELASNAVPLVLVP
jgi:hypothetical protein